MDSYGNMNHEELLRWLIANKASNASYPKDSPEHAAAIEKVLQDERNESPLISNPPERFRPNLVESDRRAVQSEKDFNRPDTINETFEPILSEWDLSKPTAINTFGQPSEERQATMVLGTKNPYGEFADYNEENPSESALRMRTRQKLQDEAKFARLQQYLKDNQFRK
jgi:hypothetical protein